MAVAKQSVQEVKLTCGIFVVAVVLLLLAVVVWAAVVHDPEWLFGGVGLGIAMLVGVMLILSGRKRATPDR